MKLRAAAMVVVACAALAACAAITRQAAVEVSEPPENAATMALLPSLGGNGARVRVRFLDYHEMEEYAAYETAAGMAEFLYVATTDDNYTLEDDLNIERGLDVFSFTHGRAREMGPSESAWAGSVEVFYRRFVLAAKNWSCVGLKADWDDVAYDPQGRPAKLLVGYYCGSPNALDDAQIVNFIQSIVIRPPPDAKPTETAPKARNALLLEVRGRPSDALRGVPAFPLRLARRYQEETDRDLFEP